MDYVNDATAIGTLVLTLCGIVGMVYGAWSWRAKRLEDRKQKELEEAEAKKPRYSSFGSFSVAELQGRFPPSMPADSQERPRDGAGRG